MTVERQQWWLRFSGLLVMGFGLLVCLAAWPPTAGATVFLADLVIWPLDGQQTGRAGETRLLSAVGGGVMAGWGAMIWMLAGRPLLLMPAEIRRVVLGSVGLWFVIDSGGSLLAGVPVNAVANVGFLLLFAVVLRRPARPAANPA